MIGPGEYSDDKKTLNPHYDEKETKKDRINCLLHQFFLGDLLVKEDYLMDGVVKLSVRDYVNTAYSGIIKKFKLKEEFDSVRTILRFFIT